MNASTISQARELNDYAKKIVKLYKELTATTDSLTNFAGSEFWTPEIAEMVDEIQVSVGQLSFHVAVLEDVSVQILFSAVTGARLGSAVK